MSYSTYTPCAELQAFVEKICVQDREAEGIVNKTTIIPACTMDLLFHYGDPYLHFENQSVVAQPRAYIAGQRTRSFSVGASGKTGIVVVNLKPWGLRGFTRCATSDFTNQFVDADCLFPRDSLSELIDALKSESEPALKVRLVQGFLTRHLMTQRDELVIAAVNRLYTEPHVKIECLAAYFDISKRQLDRRFLRFTGLTAKKFQTVIRLQRSLGNLQDDLSVTAHESGYFDQAHMNHDYQRLINATPSFVLSRALATPLMRFYAKPTNMSRFYNHLYLQ